jgi:ABC-2 type transport system permease protein
MRRTYLVARRDFLGYVKTWGFWISFFLPFIFGAIILFASQMNINVQPLRYETILDETGEHKPGIIALHDARYDNIKIATLKGVSGFSLSDADNERLSEIFKTEGFEAALSYADDIKPGLKSSLQFPEQKTVFIAPPSNNIEELKSIIREEKLISAGDDMVKLDGVLHINNDREKPEVNYWSPNINNNTVQNLARDYFNDRATRDYLKTGGLTPQGLAQARTGSARIKAFDPTKTETGSKEGQAVTDADKIPQIVSVVMAGILWLTVFSGSYMLLTSMLEEKLNKLMEMMLASTRFSEIIFGKLIGVAALTIAAMLPYIIIGILGIVAVFLMADAAVVAGLAKAFSLKMMIFFPVFLILGYIFYGALFIALGALAESMQDAQTLTTPIMLMLTACIMVVPLGLESPDSALLDFAAWFPLSAPFAAIVRLPSDPPWWELIVSASFLFVVSIGVIWVAGRVFRYGVLSGSGVKGVKSWIARVIFRRKPVA